MNYHSRIMNIPFDRLKSDSSVSAAIDMDETRKGELSYKFGHRDARHAAAEIANEADAQIQALTEEREAMKAAAEEALDAMQGASEYLVHVARLLNPNEHLVECPAGIWCANLDFAGSALAEALNCQHIDASVDNKGRPCPGITDPEMCHPDCPHREECRRDWTEKKCPVRDGTGLITVERRDDGTLVHMECTDCNGTGRIVEDKEERDG